MKVITDLNWSIQEVEASPDGAIFVVDGLSGPDRQSLKRHVRVFRSDGEFERDLPTRLPPEHGTGRFTFDPTGWLLIHNPGPEAVLLEMPSGRFLAPTPNGGIGAVSQSSRYWAGNAKADNGLQVYDREGNMLFDWIVKQPGGLGPRFSPDLDGRFLIWGDRTATIYLADLVEIRRRLSAMGLGW